MSSKTVKKNVYTCCPHKNGNTAWAVAQILNSARAAGPEKIMFSASEELHSQIAEWKNFAVTEVGFSKIITVTATE
jgi:hypothetical protein